MREMGEMVAFGAADLDLVAPLVRVELVQPQPLRAVARELDGDELFPVIVLAIRHGVENARELRLLRGRRQRRHVARPRN
jgi:hypothetical protein